MTFQLDVYRSGETLMISVAGRVVLDECERFKASCVPYVQAGIARVAVEMSGVDFIDSAGLGVLVGLKMTCNKVKAKMSIVSPSQGVADILYVSKLDGIFDVVTGAPAEVLRSDVIQPENRIGPGAAAAGGMPPPLQPAAPPQMMAPQQPVQPYRPPVAGAPGMTPQVPPGPLRPAAPPAPQAAPAMGPPPVAGPPRLGGGPGGGARPAAGPGGISPIGGAPRGPSEAPPQPGRIAPMGAPPARPGMIAPMGGGHASPPPPGGGPSYDGGFSVPDEPLFAPPIGDPMFSGGGDAGDGMPELLGGEMGGGFGSDFPAPPEAAPVGFMEDIPLPDDMPDLLTGGPMPELESATLDEALGAMQRPMNEPPRLGSSALRPPPRTMPRPQTPTSPGTGGGFEPMVSQLSGTLDEVPMLRSDSITPLGTPIGPASGGGESHAKTPKEMVEIHCQRAFEYMRQGAYEESIREYRRALEYNADYLPALNNLAIVYEKKPSWHAQAIEQWERVYQLSKMKGDQKHIDRAQKHLASLRKMQ